MGREKNEENVGGIVERKGKRASEKNEGEKGRIISNVRIFHKIF